MNKIELHAFKANDRDWLVANHADHYAREEGFDDSFGVLVAQIIDDFLANHNPEDEAGWIAWQDGVRLGSIFCVRLDESHAKLRLFLLVDAARGKGLGLRLLTTCMEFARDHGYKGMQLWTHKSHEAACALYLRNGWQIVSENPVTTFGKPNIEQTFTISF